MKKFKFISLLLAVTMLTTALVGCSNGTSSDSEKSTENTNSGKLKPIVIGATSQGDYLAGSTGVGQQLGIFEDELAKAGYSVSFSGFQAGPAVNEAFVSGDIDVAILGDLPAITAQANGLNTQAFAVSSILQYGILAQPDFEFTSFKDFEGKKIATYTGTIIQYFIENVLKDNGVDISKVEFVNDLSIQTFLSGDVDFFPNMLYTVREYEQQGYGKIIFDTLDNPQYATESISYASSDFIKENPDAIEAIYNAEKKIAEYARDNSEEYYQMLSDASSGTFSVESFKYQYPDTSKLFDDLAPEFSEDRLELLKDVKDYAANNGLLVKDFDFDSWIYKVE